MSWLSFTARKWFSAALTIARRCDGRAWNARHTKFLSQISKLQPKPNPASCHFSCVQIEIEFSSGAKRAEDWGRRRRGNEAIMIEPSEEDVGRAVVYTGPGGALEDGVITSFNNICVFV